MTTLIEYIRDTIHELMYKDDKRLVYIVGKYYFARLILVQMIPDTMPVPDGWEALTQPMTKAQATVRINNFKLMSVVEPEKSADIAS